MKYFKNGGSDKENQEIGESKLAKIKEKVNDKPVLTVAISLIICLSLGLGYILYFKNSYTKTITRLEEKNSTLSTIIVDKESKIAELNNKVTELNEKLDEASPWFEMKAEEQEELEAELERKALEEQREKELQEQKEREEQEKKEKQGYETGITYNQLARTPDNYVGEKVKFKGKVVQVLEGDGETQIRLAIDGNYDTIIFCSYDSSIVSSRVLEDDYITVMGVSGGLLTYESTMGSDITIPSVLVEKIDM